MCGLWHANVHAIMIIVTGQSITSQRGSMLTAKENLMDSYCRLGARYGFYQPSPSRPEGAPLVICAQSGGAERAEGSLPDMPCTPLEHGPADTSYGR